MKVHRHGTDAAALHSSRATPAAGDDYAQAWKAAQPDEGRAVVRVDLEAREVDWEFVPGQRTRAWAFGEALAIATAGTAAFGISVDLDVVAPEEAPGVGTPVKGGIAGATLARAIERIGGRGDLAAVELVEYCPRLDREGASARIAVDIMAAALCGPRHDAQILADADEDAWKEYVHEERPVPQGGAAGPRLG